MPLKIGHYPQTAVPQCGRFLEPRKTAELTEIARETEKELVARAVRDQEQGGGLACASGIAYDGGEAGLTVVWDKMPRRTAMSTPAKGYANCFLQPYAAGCGR